MANWLGLRFVGRLRQSVLQHLLMVSQPATSGLQRGDLLARLSNDTDKVQDMVLEVPFFLVSHLLTLVFYCAMLFWIDWQLATIALAFVPMFFIHQRFFGPSKRKASQQFFHLNGELLAFEEQALGNMRGINSFNVESKMEDKHISAFERARRWAMKMRFLDQGFASTLAVLIYICGIVIVFAGIDRIKETGLGIGALVSFLIYLGYLSVPVRGFAQAPMQLLGDLGAAQRVLELLKLQSNIKETAPNAVLSSNKGAIRFENVSFAYPDGDPVLKDITLNIEPGESVALVGPSGAGKSTIAQLLMRFYDPVSGSISIDETDIREISIASLRDNVSTVWQNPFFLNETIRNNLLIACPNASTDELIAACKLSGTWEFIEELNNGLDAAIGMGGVELSGGQYQRLAIAQAILRDTPILVLDEATSALDSLSERALTESLEQLRKDRTTLIIAHRYSSIRAADKVVYFNGDGSITMDSHENLYAQHRDYRDAVIWQEVKTK